MPPPRVCRFWAAFRCFSTNSAYDMHRRSPQSRQSALNSSGYTPCHLLIKWSGGISVAMRVRTCRAFLRSTQNARPSADLDRFARISQEALVRTISAEYVSVGVLWAQINVGVLSTCVGKY